MSTAIQAAVIDEVDGQFVFQDVVLDQPAADELLVRIVASGLCHTDLAVVHGDIPGEFPRVLGREGSGIVEKIGSGVTRFAVGDRVALSFASCGHCVNCLAGRVAYCVDFMALNFGGVRDDGTGTMTAADGSRMVGAFFGQSSFGTYALVAQHNAVAVDADVPLAITGPLGCGIQTGAGTVLNTLGVGAGDSVIVSGTGAVGLSAIMAAKAVGATTIIAIDVLPERLEAALRFGATHAIDGRGDDVVAQILALTDGLGAAYAVDTTAVPAVLATLAGATRFGADIALLGVAKPTATIPIGLFAGKSVHNAIEGDAVPQNFIPKLIAMYRAGDFPFDQLITTYPFAEIDKAIADTQSGAAIKAVLLMPEAPQA